MHLSVAFPIIDCPIIDFPIKEVAPNMRSVRYYRCCQAVKASHSLSSHSVALTIAICVV